MSRRRFSDLYLEALEAQFCELEGDVLAPVTLPSDIADAFDDDENSPKTPKLRTFEATLEEAHEEAAYNPSATSFMHVPSKQAGSAMPANKMGHRRTISGTPSACCTPSLAAQGAGAPRWASSAALCHSPSRGASAAASSSETPSASVRRGSVQLRHLRTPSAGASSSVLGAAKTAGGAAAPAAATHRRLGSEGMGRMAPSDVGGRPRSRTFDARENADADLEFSEQMAESMDVEALEELANVLRRTIATRNAELVTLQLRRDELMHERDFRRQTVSALVAQVDRSAYVKEEKKQKEKRRSMLG